MQIGRLFEIVYLLLDREKLSARELAERFEVSTRTIYRDVETLSAAGIPIYMSKGKGGGISLLPDFVLNKAVLNDADKNSILSALHGLNRIDEDSVSDTLSRLSLLFGENNTSFIEIDYHDWGEMIKEQFETSKRAILTRKLLTFDYFSAQGVETRRKVEPYVLWFKDKTWYLKCFCLQRQEQRTFRLSRMKRVSCTGEDYIPRKWTDRPVEEENQLPETEIVLRVHPSQKYRIFDDFPESDINQMEDGSYRVTMNFIEDEWVYGYLLSYGCWGTVEKPAHIKEILLKRLRASLAQYET